MDPPNEYITHAIIFSIVLNSKYEGCKPVMFEVSLDTIAFLVL